MMPDMLSVLGQAMVKRNAVNRSVSFRRASRDDLVASENAGARGAAGLICLEALDEAAIEEATMRQAIGESGARSRQGHG